LMVETVEPSDEVWQRIKSRIAVPEVAPEIAPPAAAPVEQPQPAVEPSSVAPPGNVVEFARRGRRWQGIPAGAGGLAAAVALSIVTLELAPDRLPAQLRPGTMSAQAPTAGRFVAVLQQDAQSPAFLLTVDLAARTLAVRRVGAQQQAGK